MTSCSYQGCYSIKKPFSNIVFFNLPTEPKKREEWIENSGNPELKELSATAKRLFCEKHFDEKYLRRQLYRTTLHPMAVLKKYGEPELISDEEGQITESIMSEEEDNLSESKQTQEGFVMDVVNKEHVSHNYTSPKKSPIILNKMHVNRKRSLNELNQESPPKRVLRTATVVDGRLVFCSTSPSINNTTVNDSTTNQNKIDAIVPSAVTFASTQKNEIETVDQFMQTETSKVLMNSITTQTDPIPDTNQSTSKESSSAQKIDDEDSYFCVKVLAEAMKRLPPNKKAEAKLHMISYMFELEHN